jgi:hypothetical protein
MRLFRGPEVVLDSEMHFRRSANEPGAAAHREMRRLLPFSEAEEVEVERAGVGFASARHRELHVMESDDRHGRRIRPRQCAIVAGMNRLKVTALALVLAAASVNAQTNAVAARIDRILREVPLIDGHNDLPYQYEERAKDHLAQIDIRQDQSKLTPPLHTDIPRLRQGRLGGQFWSVYIPTTLKGADAVRAVLDQIDVVYRLIDLYPDTFELARTADDVVRIHRS